MITLKKSRTSFLLLITGAMMVAAASCKKSSPASTTSNFKATLNGANETPPNSSTATGTATASYDPGTKMISYTFSWSNLSAPAKAMHFHVGAPGVSGNVIIPVPSASFTSAASGSASGSAPFPDSLLNQLMIGNFYANIHDANYPGGEIRGQLIKQ